MSLWRTAGSLSVIFLVLLWLLGATVVAARQDLGLWNFPVAATIAVMKSVLIAAYFMELRDSKPLTRVVACAGLLWLAILLSLTAADFETRM